jgi:hypothetical protein
MFWLGVLLVYMAGLDRGQDISGFIAELNIFLRIGKSLGLCGVESDLGHGFYLST